MTEDKPPAKPLDPHDYPLPDLELPPGMLFDCPACGNRVAAIRFHPSLVTNELDELELGAPLSEPTMLPCDHVLDGRLTITPLGIEYDPPVMPAVAVTPTGPPAWTVVLHGNEVVAVFAKGQTPVLPTLLGKTAVILAETPELAAALAVAHVRKLEPPQEPDLALNALAKLLLQYASGIGSLGTQRRQPCPGCGRDIAQRWRIQGDPSGKPGRKRVTLGRRNKNRRLVTVLICPLCGPVHAEENTTTQAEIVVDPPHTYGSGNEEDSDGSLEQLARQFGRHIQVAEPPKEIGQEQ